MCYAENAKTYQKSIISRKDSNRVIFIDYPKGVEVNVISLLRSGGTTCGKLS